MAKVMSGFMVEVKTFMVTGHVCLWRARGVQRAIASPALAMANCACVMGTAGAGIYSCKTRRG